MKKIILCVLITAFLVGGIGVSDSLRLTSFAWADEGDGGDGGEGGDGGDSDGDGSDGDSDSDDGDSDSDSDDSDSDDSDSSESVGDSDGGRNEPFTAFIDLVFGGERDVVPNELVALVSTSPTLPERLELATSGLSIVEVTPLGGLGSEALRIAVPPGLSLDAAEEITRTVLPNATIDQNDLYDMAGVGCAEDCWAASLVALTPTPPAACSRGAPIALLDTAVSQTHPSLAGANVTVRSFLRDEMGPATPYHGTAIAALLVGQSSPGASPMAPGARLMAAEVIGTHNGAPRGDALAIVKALNWAAETRVRVVALSLEGRANRMLHQAIRQVAERATIVAAAGNSGPRGDAAFPAAYSEVIAVAAVDERLRPYRNGTRGTYVELTAPGVEIPSAGEGGARQSWTGTSFAVPFAVAAVLRARAASGGDPEVARRLLHEEARDLGAPGRDEVYGYGLIQSPGDRCW